MQQKTTILTQNFYFIVRHAGAGLLLLLFLISCTSKPSSVPSAFSDTGDSLDIFPDYRDVTIPPNIAPLNFMVNDASASEYVATIGDLVCGAGQDGKLEMDTTAWRQILSAAKGQSLPVTVYAHRAAGWVRYPSFMLHVAPEDIDPYLSYRLIEPGYELYRQLGLYQRNLTNYHEAVIYENNRSFDNDDNHCVNCHNYQAYDTQRMLFHVRAAHGGTVLVEGSEAHKVAIRHDSILGAGVYPSWHPTQPLIAFSTNKTGQVFHMQHAERIEVLDEASDLLLYDVEKNTVSNIFHTDDALETFPCWAPDGRTLYYCSARLPESLRQRLEAHQRGDADESYSPSDIALRYDSLLYNIYSISFDPSTRRFGDPQLVVDAAGMGKSASVPRVSPDGRYLLYTLGDYGQFHIWHKSADLWVARLQPELPSPQNPSSNSSSASSSTSSSDASSIQSTSPTAAPQNEDRLASYDQANQYPLTAANSPDADSYHSWSSNGRWLVVASRRLDGNFSRVFISYFDHSGQAHRAFLLPQQDPELNILFLKSYNVPELTKSAVRISVEKLNHVVRHTEAVASEYSSLTK